MDGEASWPRWEEIGDGNIPPFLASLCQTLPEQLYVLYDPSRSRYCYRALALTEDCGLLAFSQPHLAYGYLAACLLGKGYSQVWAVSVDYACTLARERHAVVNSVFLCDDFSRPVIHHVR